jgi:hypothetical protein
VWELICHHEYCWGTIAADRSPWHSDGIASGVQPLPGNQVGLKFSAPQSQIAIPRRPNDPWGHIRSLIVEIQARFIQAGGTVIDADNSFHVRLDNQGVVIVELAGHTYNLAQIPLGVWHHFSFHHDGFNQFGWGFHNWTLPDGSGGGAGGGGVTSGQVSGVGTKGILIGNRIGAPNQHLTGDIALVKIWRHDPKSMQKEFLTRPLDPATAKCWAEFIRKLNEWVRAHPECVEWFNATLGGFEDEFFSALAQKSQDKIDEFHKMCLEYSDLWRAGKVGSLEMRALLVRFRDWLKAEGLLSLDDPDLQRRFDNPCLTKLVEALPGLDCDPEFQALIAAILGVKT